MAIGLVRPDRQARVEQQNAPVRPGSQQPAVPGRRGKGVRVLLFEELVDVAEGGGSGCGGPDGEAEAVGLVGAVVGVLAEDYAFDGVEGRVAGPFFCCVSLLVRLILR